MPWTGGPRPSSPGRSVRPPGLQAAAGPAADLPPIPILASLQGRDIRPKFPQDRRSVLAGRVPGTEVTLLDDPAITETELVSALPGVVFVEVVLIFVADVGVTELPGSAGAFAGLCGDYSSEGVFPVDVDVASHERAEACDIFVSHGVALGAQLV